MKQSRISLNVNGVNVPNPELLNKHIKALNPRWLLIMDNSALCRDYARQFPATNVINRSWALTQGDENVYSKLTPVQWLEARLPDVVDGVWLHTANEAGVNVKWDIELMKLVVSRGLKNVKLVIGNYSVGTPAIGDWSQPDKKEWFELLDRHRDQFVLGLHEYFYGIAPSGFVGGYPDGSWSDGRTNLHPNYENRANWPIDASIIGQLWHCGRLMSINAAAIKFGVKPPRIVLTEHGADAIAEMIPWGKKFKPSNGQETLGGWKTLTNLWDKLIPNKSAQLAYYENVTYLDKSLYQHFPNVEGQLLFTWSSAPKWSNFDLSEATSFQSLLEIYAVNAPDVVTPPPVVKPPPVIIPVPEVVMVTIPAQMLLSVLDSMQATINVVKQLIPESVLKEKKVSEIP